MLAAASGCGKNQPPACQDADHDGFGVGCIAGPDCDDRDPARAAQCDDAGALDCETEPLTSGCPCLRGDRQECYAGSPETLAVGMCRSGKTACIDGSWSECDGQLLPTFEVCNQVDDDCDGVVDEGVQSPCGGCNDECIGGVWGLPVAPFEPDANLDVTAAGELTLRREERIALTLWVPNTDEGTVSKIDAVAARELARYRTRGKQPIRVAVDHRGDAWVLDASGDGPARLTKIAGTPQRCRDRDGNGLRTSQRPDDVLALGEDECVILDLPLGAAGDDARALMLDGAVAPDSERAGNVWVGLSGAQRVLMLDSDTGAWLASVDLVAFHPYVGAFDAFGVLWLIDRDGWLARIDPGTDPAAVTIRAVPFACYALEALSIDVRGQLMLSGFGCESVLTYDPQRDSFRQLPVPDLLSPRGVVALPSASWVAYTSGQIGRVGRDPLSIGNAYPLAALDATPFETIALSADSLGQVWAISTQGGPNGRGLATRFDPEQRTVTAQVPVGAGPRGGGDLTGFALAGDFVAEGQATHLFRGCGQDAQAKDLASQAHTRWRNLHIASVLGAAASIEVAMRHASDEAALSAQPFRVLGVVPTNPAPFALDLPDGGMVEVRLTLRSPGAIGAPRVARIGVEWNCPGPD
jgi:hypothetical protein